MNNAWPAGRHVNQQLLWVVVEHCSIQLGEGAVSGGGRAVLLAAWPCSGFARIALTRQALGSIIHPGEAKNSGQKDSARECLVTSPGSKMRIYGGRNEFQMAAVAGKKNRC